MSSNSLGNPIGIQRCYQFPILPNVQRCQRVSTRKAGRAKGDRFNPVMQPGSHDLFLSTIQSIDRCIALPLTKKTTQNSTIGVKQGARKTLPALTVGGRHSSFQFYSYLMVISKRILRSLRRTELPGYLLSQWVHEYRH